MPARLFRANSPDLCNFQNAGFSVVAVEEDLLYKLVPPNGMPHAGSAEQGGQVAQPAADGPNFCD